MSNLPAKALLPALLVAIPFASNAATTDIKFGGFVKLDATYSQYSDGDLGAGVAQREFYYPSSVPVGGESENGDFDMSARGSRFNLSTTTDIDGQKLKAFFEMDFYGGGGNEVVSNSAHPRLRHAFFSLGNLTFGQTWSTFLNTGALPETVDFLGPSEGTVFIRQPLIRYTNGNVQLAIENSETFLDGTGASDDSSLPDFVARYNMATDFGKFTAAAVVRQLSYETTAIADDITTTSVDESAPAIDETTAIGYGLSVSGVVPVMSPDKVKFMLTHGKGIGRYVGLATVRDGVYNAADEEIDMHTVLNGFVSYQHAWSSKLRTNLTYSMLQASFDADDTKNTADVNSIHVNLMYNPVEKVTYGVEYAQATRTVDDAADSDGSLQRLQFSAKYAF